MNDWVRRNLKRGLEWYDGETFITISHTPSGIDVYVYPDGQTESSIQLLTSYGYNTIHICDLRGAEVGSVWHNKKYGTLLGNLIIQAYKLVFQVAEHDKIIVHGTTQSILSDDDPGLIEDCKRRSYFWSRFGLRVKNPEKRESRMECTLAELKEVDGEVYSGLKTSLPLQKFHLNVHAPVFLEKDLESLRSFDIKKNDIDLVIEETKNINQHDREMRKEFRVFVLAISALFTFVAFQILPGDSFLIYSVFFSLLLGLVSYYVFLRFSPASWLNLMPSGILLRKSESDKSNALKYIKSKIGKALINNTKSIDRIYKTLKKQLTDFSTCKEVDRIYYRLDQIDATNINNVMDLGRISLFLKDKMKEFNDKNKKESLTKEDFIFGRFSSMSVNQIKSYLDRIDSQFCHHVNRFVGTLENNSLVIHGTPDSRIDELWNALKDEIAYIEFYAIDGGGGLQSIGMKVYIKSGVLDFSRVWCTWKDKYFEYALRAFKVLFTIKDAFEKPLVQKTYVRWSSASYQNTSLVSQDYLGFATEIADISGARYSDSDLNSFLESQQMVKQIPISEE